MTITDCITVSTSLLFVCYLVSMYIRALHGPKFLVMAQPIAFEARPIFSRNFQARPILGPS